MARPTLLFAIIVLSVAPAHAHGGEDHGEPSTAVTVAPAERFPTIEGSSELFEVLVKLSGPAIPEQELSAHVFVTRFATNEPVGGGTVEISVSGTANTSVLATPTTTDGLYDLLLPALPEGSLDATASVDAEEESDLILLGSLTIDTPSPEDEMGGRDERESSTWWLVLPVGIGVAILVVWLSRRRRSS